MYNLAHSATEHTPEEASSQDNQLDVYVNFDGTTVRYFDDHSIDSTSVHTVIDYNSRFEKDFTDEF
jgi:hypothetical protein